LTTITTGMSYVGAAALAGSVWTHAVTVTTTGTAGVLMYGDLVAWDCEPVLR
jgi:hypothetical protein